MERVTKEKLTNDKPTNEKFTMEKVERIPKVTLTKEEKDLKRKEKLDNQMELYWAKMKS